MGDVLFDGLDDWSNGVITSNRPDQIPQNAAQRGWNSELTALGADKAVVRKRQGLSTLNETPITGSGAIIGQYLFQPRDAATDTLSQVHLLVTDNGRLEKLVSGTLTNLSTTMDSSSPNPPDFETANNLCFIANGQDVFKLTSALVPQEWGFARPSAPTLAAGAAGVMTGDYEVALTFFNSVTGHESSRSDVSTITLAAQQLVVTIPNAGDPQVDYVRVYIRKTTLSAFLFRVVSGTGYSSTGGGWPDNYGNTSLNLSDNALNLLDILSPDTEENNEPPQTIKYICWHQSRMFASDGRTLFYSKVELPEAFDPDFEEPINPDDGQQITALHSIGGVLLIFKSRSIYGLFGDDPNSWYVRLLDSDTGCTSHRSVVTTEGMTCWWSVKGPMQITGANDAGQPTAVGFELIRPTIDTSVLNYAAFGSVCAAANSSTQRVLFALPETGSSRLSLILPLSYRANRWEASKWDPMDVASLATLLDSNGNPFISLGGYAGQAFQMETGYTDGVPSGTTSGTFVASGTSVSVITDALATFLNTGGKLIERKVTVIGPDSEYIGRGRITSNDATSLTLAAAISGLTNGTTYTYYVGGPDFQWDLPWRDFNLPYFKKRFEFLYVQALSGSSTSLICDLAFNWDTAAGQTKIIDLTADDETWDAPMWDSALYSTGSVDPHRVRVGRTGRIWRLRVRNPVPAISVTLLKVAMQAERQTTKS